MHQHDQRLRAFVLHHQGLDHHVFIDAELRCRLGRAAMFDVVIDMLGEGHAAFAQPLGGGGFAHVGAHFFLGHE